MNTKTYKFGTTVFNRCGESARYVASTPEGHAVVPNIVTLDDEGNDHDGEGSLTAWHEVFDKPPRAVLDKEIAEANQRLEALRKEIQLAREDRSAVDAEITARRNRIKQHEQLKLLDDFLASKITHYVLQEYGRVAILPLAEATAEYSNRSLRLLTLYGKTSDWSAEWSLNQYADGSGSASPVFPCTSLETAQAKAKELIELKWAEWRKSPSNYYYIGNTFESAKKLGLPVPEDVSTRIKKDRIDTAQKHIDEAEKTLAQAKEELTKAQKDD